MPDFYGKVYHNLHFFVWGGDCHSLCYLFFFLKHFFYGQILSHHDAKNHIAIIYMLNIVCQSLDLISDHP